MHAQLTIPALRPEAALLLCCARTSLGSQQAKQIHMLVREDLDWTALISMAGRHRLLPLVYQHLHTICPDALPSPALDYLRRAFRATAQRNLALTTELVQIVRLFEAHGISVLPWKGPVLAHTAYGSLALRTFGDLDLLISQSDLPQAKQLLVARGYRSRLSESREQLRLRFHYHWDFHCQEERYSDRLALEVLDGLLVFSTAP